MKRTSTDPPSRPGAGARWSRLALGLLLLSTLIGLLATVPPPGNVLKHNTALEIDATALFYMDLDRMPEIERALEEYKSADPDAAP